MHTEQNPKIPSTEQTQPLTTVSRERAEIEVQHEPLTTVHRYPYTNSRSQDWDAMNKPKRHISLRSSCFQKLKPSRLPFEAKDQEKHTHTRPSGMYTERDTR